jgi:hypothetical protein
MEGEGSGGGRATLDRRIPGGRGFSNPNWTLPRCAFRQSSNDFDRKSLVIRPQHKEHGKQILSGTAAFSAYQCFLRLSVANAPVPASRHSTQMAK